MMRHFISTRQSNWDGEKYVECCDLTFCACGIASLRGTSRSYRIFQPEIAFTKYSILAQLMWFMRYVENSDKVTCVSPTSESVDVKSSQDHA